MKKMKLFGERSISPQDESSTIGIKKVVSRISSRLMPSIPTK